MNIDDFKPALYPALLEEKKAFLSKQLAPFTTAPLTVFESPTQGFRARAEFRLWHDDDDIYYAMFAKGNNRDPIRIDHFPIAYDSIQVLMPKLLEALKACELLKTRLFQVEFLSGLSNDMLVTLIYHKRLDEQWQLEAQQLSQALGIKIIGRSKKQKVVLGDDFIIEALNVNGQTYHYKQLEGGFTQPNAYVNQHMLSWAQHQVKTHLPKNSQLLELYCGNGNFTAALAPLFDQVLATEISKTSVYAAQFNFEKNQSHNVKVARLSSEEFTSAYHGEREFKRLKSQDIEISDYNFNCILVDPPRAGLDAQTLKLCQGFEYILYVSCNPETLTSNLGELTKTHDVIEQALFDQFPYTHHIETGVLLKSKA